MVKDAAEGQARFSREILRFSALVFIPDGTHKVCGGGEKPVTAALLYQEKIDWIQGVSHERFGKKGRGGGGGGGGEGDACQPKISGKHC